MDYETDKKFVQKVCKKIQSGNRDAINEIRKVCERDLVSVIQRCLSDPDQTEDLLNEFWNVLSDGNTLSKYKGISSLKTFLTIILNKRVKKRNCLTDKAEADRICKELQSGNRNAIEPLVHKYEDYLINYAKKELYPYISDSDDVVQELWLTFLEKDKQGEYKVCQFRGNALLKTYLTSFLKHKIKDKTDKISRERRRAKKHHIIQEQEEPKELTDRAIHEFFNEMKETERRQVVHELLSQFEKTDSECASLVKMRFEGLSYRQIVNVRQEPDAKLSEREIEKKIASLRQRHKRCLEKLETVLKHTMKAHGLEREELLE